MRRRNVKWVVLILALLVIAVGIGGYVVYNQQQAIDTLQTEKVLGVAAYETGAFDTTTGKLITTEENEYSLYTPGYYKLEGVQIELAKNSDLTYKVFYYGEDKDFIACTAYLNGDYVAANVTAEPSGAKYFRIMINTNEVKVTPTNKAKLVKEVTVTVAK